MPDIKRLYEEDEIDAGTLRALTLATPDQQESWLKLVADPNEHAPRGERDDIDAQFGRGAAAYGEITREAATRLLRWLQPNADDVFFDLGSGAGRLVTQVAWSTPVRRAVGTAGCRLQAAGAAQALSPTSALFAPHRHCQHRDRSSAACG